MARAAELIAAGAVGGGGESVLFTPGGSRLWQDEGGLGKEAGEDDIMTEAAPEEEEEEMEEKEQAPREAEQEEQGAEEEAGSPVRGRDESTLSCRMAFTPGGRLHAALSPIAQEEDEEEEEAEGSRRCSRTSIPAEEEMDEDRDEHDAPARDYLQPPATSTPGKEYHVRKTALGGTPMRLAVAPVNDEDDDLSSPKDSEGSFITRVAVRATSAQKEEHGSSVILTPVRRSARKQKQWNVDDTTSVGEQLAGCGYAYQPNKNIMYPEDDHDDETLGDGNTSTPYTSTNTLSNTSDKTPIDSADEQQAATREGTLEVQEVAAEEEIAAADLNLKRKAAASPSPRKPTARTPHSSAKKLPVSAPSSAQDEVNMKRQMLRAKLAEADSPLPPPSRIIP